MGPLVSAAHRDTVTSVPRRLARRVPRLGARAAPGSGSRPTVVLPEPRATASRSEEIFGPVVARAAVRRRGRRDRARQRHRSTASPARSGPRTSAARIRVSRGVKSGVLSVNSHSSVRYTTPFGGMKHPASAASSGPDAARALHRDQERLLRDGCLVSGIHGELDRDHPTGSTMHDRSTSPSASKDRVAVITGGASGIGLATARRFAAEGAMRRDRRPRPGDAARPRQPRSAGPVPCTSTSPTRHQVDALFDGVAAEFGRVDIAFNNAGISPADDDSIETTELPAWDRVQDVNLKSVYLCSRAALRHMVPAGQRLDHQHRVVRRAARLGDVADLLHRVEGRRARDDPRARRAVRAPGHPRERALPRAGEHAAAAGAVREGPRARAAPARARADRPVRRARGARGRRRVPRLATTRRSSPRPPSSSTAASRTPT